MDKYLTEAHWKANGLTKRTAMEKIRFKKTMVSEALRAYGAVVKSGLDKHEAKMKALKAIDVALDKCLSNHRTNALFVAHIKEMQKKLNAEVKALNERIEKLQVKDVILHSELFKVVFAFAKKERNEENLEFLYFLGKTSPPKLIERYIRPNAPREVNISYKQKQAILEDPTDRDAWEAAQHEIMELVASDTMKRFKNERLIRL